MGTKTGEIQEGLCREIDKNYEIDNYIKTEQITKIENLC